MTWKRVSKTDPCIVCGKPDWCLRTEDKSASICARIDVNARKQVGEAGWLHIHQEGLRRPRTARTIPLANSAESAWLDVFAAECSEACELDELADSLGLSVQSLHRLSVGRSIRHQGAWTFPMRNTTGRVTGIRLRFPDGQKRSVRGGKEGLFLPRGIDGEKRLLVAEGPTDTAALLDLQFPAVGRPNCTGGVEHLTQLVRIHRFQEIVLVADRDEPGQRGARRLANRLRTLVPRLRIVVPPAKDVRQWLREGATHSAVESLIYSAPVQKLRINAGGTK